LEQAYPTMAKRITYIHHGSEVVDTLPSKNHKKKLKKELFGLEPEQTLFTFVGRFQWRKNVPALIAGFKLAWLQNPNIRLYLHSGNQDMGGDLKQTVFYVKPPTMSDTDNLKAMKAIIFTPDSFSVNNSLSRDALNMVYQASDAFVTTTLGEGWGLPITEAMANGTPVIAPKFSAITEIIGDNAERGNYWTDSVDYNQDVYYPIPSSKGGYVHTRPEDVATKLLDFVTNKKDHLSKISAAHQWTQQRQWPMIAKQWLDLFSQL
jgi:glycosyltransferase involved in cell wall biosynthesis